VRSPCLEMLTQGADNQGNHEEFRINPDWIAQPATNQGHSGGHRLCPHYLLLWEVGGGVTGKHMALSSLDRLLLLEQNPLGEVRAYGHAYVRDLPCCIRLHLVRVRTAAADVATYRPRPSLPPRLDHLLDRRSPWSSSTFYRLGTVAFGRCAVLSISFLMERPLPKLHFSLSLQIPFHCSPHTPPRLPVPSHRRPWCFQEVTSWR
jgi:hypothetical protein